MKTIYGQVIASTAIDAHGEKRTKDQLEQILASIPEPSPVYQCHDRSLPILAKAYNHRLVDLPDGEYGIACDVDVYDETAFEKFKGFSISFTRGYEIRTHQHDQYDVTIFFDSLFVEESEIIELLEMCGSDVRIKAIPVGQKAVVEFAWIIIGFIAAEVFGGFFKKIGADAWDRLIAMKTKSGNQIKYRFEFPLAYKNQSVNVIIDAPSDVLDTLRHGDNICSSLYEYVGYIIGEKQVSTISLTVLGADRKAWSVLYMADEDGKQVVPNVAPIIEV